MWGQGACDGTLVLGLGIIPTRVGTSQRVCICVIMNRDHPHACGDKYGLGFKYERHLGSSPRVWGQDCIYAPCVERHGIIPTRMGTRYLCRHFDSRRWDHPHAYGDKFNFALLYSLFEGSSPRVWGQEVINMLIYQIPRIIPTRMGTRTTHSVKSLNCRDHPHAYGDKKPLRCTALERKGSSPRVWGQEVR